MRILKEIVFSGNRVDWEILNRSVGGLYYLDVSSLHSVAFRCRDWDRVREEVFEYCCVTAMDLRVYTCVLWHVNAASCV